MDDILLADSKIDMIKMFEEIVLPHWGLKIAPTKRRDSINYLQYNKGLPKICLQNIQIRGDWL